MGLAKLKELREEAGLTQTELAEKLFISAQSVSKWENGLSEPDIDTLCALADIFKVSIDTLVARKEVYKDDAIYRIKSYLESSENLIGDVLEILRASISSKLMGKEKSDTYSCILHKNGIFFLSLLNE